MLTNSVDIIGRADPNSQVVKPKKAKSAYLCFASELMASKPEGEAVTVAMKRAGNEWQKLSDEQKKKYEAMHEADVKR